MAGTEVTAAQKLAEAFLAYDAALTEWAQNPSVAPKPSGAYREMLLLAHQILQEETDDKE